MNWTRVFTFVVSCMVMCLVMMYVSGGGPEIAFITLIAFAVGYAYGAFQMLYSFNKQMLENEDREKNE